MGIGRARVNEDSSLVIRGPRIRILEEGFKLRELKGSDRNDLKE